MRRFLITIVLSYLCFISLAQDSLLLDSRDGKRYRVVMLGEQTWMAENLRFDLGQSQMNKRDWGEPKSYVYESSLSNSEGSEFFYNWRAARLVCPSGWHLPSELDFEVLLKTVSSGDKNLGYTVLRKGGNSGFNAIDVGYGRHIDQSLVEFYPGTCTFWIDSDAKPNARPVYHKYVAFNHRYKKIIVTKATVFNAYSVRCVRVN